LRPSDRPRIEELLGSLTAFTDDERAVAMEVVDARLARPDSDAYRFILSVSNDHDSVVGDERIAGYICYGRTPMTQSTYDLYWLGTSPAFAPMGIAQGLVAQMEDEIAAAGGGLIRVETGSREGIGAAVHFYDALGFERTATIVDFYAPSDDLIVFTKRVGPRLKAHEPALDEAALYDAAFGYRDYGAERDFLLACARRFGEREVRQVLAWASGPGRHLRAFADLGIAGVGTDVSPTMIAYALRLSSTRGGVGPEIRFMQAALDERPPGNGLYNVDLSFVPLSSIHLLTTAAAMVRHLRVAAELLQVGGLHVIEATHPADLSPGGVSHTEWTEVRGDATVEARFRMHVDRMTLDRVVPVTLEVLRTTARKSSAAGVGGRPSPQASPSPRLRQEDRWFIPDLDGWHRIIGTVQNLRLVAALGDFNVNVPFEHAAAWRLILVLKRTT
jgi:ribosomal protein S18 acetylase RimI-like enzyme